jgi:hypothetical protein
MPTQLVVAAGGLNPALLKRQCEMEEEAVGKAESWEKEGAAVRERGYPAESVYCGFEDRWVRGGADATGEGAEIEKQRFQLIAAQSFNVGTH